MQPAPLSPSPLAGLTFSVAGPGRVGSSLARWAGERGATLVETAGREGVDGLASAGQDFLLVAVPDRALAEVAAALARRPQARVVLHTAGGMTGEILAPLRAGGSAVGSFHPLKAFPRPLPDPAEAAGVFFAVDGDGEAEALARRLAGAWGAVTGHVPEDVRTLYHFAATLAAGGAVTLLAAAGEIAARLGLPAAVTAGYLELCRGAVAEAARAGEPADALTGPAVRGDGETISRHLEALATHAPDKLELARALTRETFKQLDRKHPLSDEQRRIAAWLAPPV